MPPTSLPADAVMKPGPRRPMSSRTVRQIRDRCRRASLAVPSLRASAGGGALDTLAGWAREAWQSARHLLGQDLVDRVVDRHDAEHAPLIVQHGAGEEVVAGDHGGDISGARVGSHADD